MTHNLTRKAVVGFSTMALVATGFGASIAMAEDATVSSINPGSITQDTGSLTITKLTPSTEDQSTNKNDGYEKTALPAGSKPINNVKFTAKRVEGVDLKTNEGWLKAKAIADNTTDAAAVLARLKKADGQTATEAAEATKVTVTETPYNGDYALGAAKDGRTAGQGKVQLADLPVGLYLVYETVDQAVDVVGGETGVPADRVTKSKPFFVTIPIAKKADEQGTTAADNWLYDINIYPKNHLNSVPTKILDDNTDGVGSGNNNTGATGAVTKSEIKYTLSADVPAVTALKHFDLVDKFKTTQLEWIDNKTYTKDVVKVGTTTLTAKTDYEFVKETSGVHTFVAMQLTDAGIAEILKPEHKGQKVTWEMYAKVLNTEGATEIPNDVFLTEVPENSDSGHWTPDKPGTPGPGVKSYYGKVTVHKKGQDGKKLNGATFELFECNPTASYAKGRQVSVDGKTSWTSEGEGLIEIDGLLANDFRNNSTFVNGESGTTWKETSAYCLYEVKAPEGYALLPQPITFQILKDNPGSANLLREMDVTNTKNHGDTPTLPVTGGAGIGILVAAGALLLGGSGVYAFAVGRKRKQH